MDELVEFAQIEIGQTRNCERPFVTRSYKPTCTPAEQKRVARRHRLPVCNNVRKLFFPTIRLQLVVRGLHHRLYAILFFGHHHSAQLD